MLFRFSHFVSTRRIAQLKGSSPQRSSRSAPLLHEFHIHLDVTIIVSPNQKPQQQVETVGSKHQGRSIQLELRVTVREDQVFGDRYVMDGEVRVDFVLDLDHGLLGAFFDVFYPHGSAVIGKHDSEIGIWDDVVEGSWWHDG